MDVSTDDTTALSQRTAQAERGADGMDEPAGDRDCTTGDVNRTTLIGTASYRRAISLDPGADCLPLGLRRTERRRHGHP
eukprot:12931202-Prorocentrum_lima.AAC.1